ncbi:MAG: hypothetical protein RPR40_12645 [Bermanella sp.]
MAKNTLNGALLLLMTLVLAACQPASPEEGSAADSRQALTHGFTLSQSEFNRLPASEQYMVANKALATMYRGVPLDEYFDLTQGLDNPVVQRSNFMSALQTRLQTPLSQDELSSAYHDVFGLDDDPETEVDDSIPARFTSFDNEHPHQRYMARMQGYPISKNQFNYWMSYFLANTIMFSPAREMDSTNSQDIARVLAYLQQTIEDDTPIRDTVRGWLHNLSRWRVSRSSENHALEMFELYLGLFNDSEEEQLNTINGGIACSSWYLTDNNNDYQLLKDDSKPDGIHTVPVLGSYISTCDDLYDIVAGHPRLIPRVTEVIVNYFLDGSPAANKEQLIQQIVNTGPSTFADVFMAIIFSKEFLLHSQRPKTFEENAFSFLEAMHWSPRANAFPMRSDVFRWVLDSTNNGRSVGVHNMGWAAMDAKIGRTPFLPMDVLSFATYHKGIRESVLMNNRAFDGRDFPEAKDFTEAEVPRGVPFEIKDGVFYVAGTENLKPELENLMPNEFIDFVFLTAVGRRASQAEQDALIAEGIVRDHLREYENEGVRELRLRRRTVGDDGDYYEYWVDDFAEIMLDYISRLPEFYYFKAVSQ